MNDEEITMKYELAKNFCKAYETFHEVGFRLIYDTIGSDYESLTEEEKIDIIKVIKEEKIMELLSEDIAETGALLESTIIAKFMTSLSEDAQEKAIDDMMKQMFQDGVKDVY